MVLYGTKKYLRVMVLYGTLSSGSIWNHHKKEKTMTLQKNYIKIVGNDDFVALVLKDVENRYKVLQKPAIQKSDTDPGVFFVFIHCANNPFSEA